MIRTVDPEKLQKVSRVAQVVSLREVCLADLRASRAVPYAAAVGHRLTVEIDDNATATVVGDGEVLSIQVRFSVAARGVDKKRRRKFIAISATFDLEYKRDLKGQAVSTDDGQIFAETNGVYNAWPYLREIVASCVARFGYPPLTIQPMVVRPAPPRAHGASSGSKAKNGS